MPRKKKNLTHKEPVKLRFKNLADGSQSIYLDIYQDGKRTYDFLKLYIVPETDAETRLQNETVLRAANAIKSQRIIELTNNAAGLKNTSVRSKILLLDWMTRYKEIQQSRGKKDGKMIDKTVNVLSRFKPKVKMFELDKAYCIGFIDFLRNKYRTKFGNPLAEQSCINYLGCLRSALNTAVRMDILPENPINKLTPSEKIKMPESKIEFLTIDEVVRLENTPNEYEHIKRAFLFSCYCGLRISDVCRLKWKDITKEGDQWRVCIVMQKTQAPLYVPLSNKARQWMPERGEASDDDRVFPDVPVEVSTKKQLAPWMKEAGITRHITYHCSRHTCATMLLTLGADLYTVSKLLGHSKIETTQIYAKVIDQKKEDAIGLLDKEFGGNKETKETTENKSKKGKKSQQKD